MLIGIYSPLPQSGKSTVAQYLQKVHGFECIPFAETLKNMAAQVLEDIGLDSLPLLMGAKTEMVYNGKTVRHLLQTLGTEWGRKCMGEDFWVDVWKRKVSYAKSIYGAKIVVDDMRFPNEFAAVQALGGWTWKVVRPQGGAPTLGHASEGALEGLLFDTELVNSGTLGDLKETIEAALRAGGRNDGRQEAVQAQG